MNNRGTPELAERAADECDRSDNASPMSQRRHDKRHEHRRDQADPGGVGLNDAEYHRALRSLV